MRWVVALLQSCLLLSLSSYSYRIALPSLNAGKFQLFAANTVEATAAGGVDTTMQTHDEVLEKYRAELESLRGTPELVDRLENLVSKHPGIENNMNLYRAIYPFKLDAFQEQGLSAMMAGNNVLVTTPTGSGKTVVGELVIYFALMLGLRVAYTTPLKALSNQKFADFKLKYGGDRVGLLTGDIAINRGAAVTIMTTEVFRNMIYDQDKDAQLSNLFMVCFDEFHFMNDPDRGTVWEESVISCPPSVRILALSATMGNVAEIKGWMSSIHGPTELVISNHRPVPLRYMFALRQGLMPLFRDPNAGPGALAGVSKSEGKLDAGSSINPAIIKLEEQAIKNAQSKTMSRSGRPFKTAKVNPQTMVARYNEIAEELHSLKLLPAIVFIFSRVGCEQSAKLVMNTRVKLLSEEEVQYVSIAISAFARANPEIPISKASVQLLRSGVGVHHAGLIPVWKAFIEDLFNANKIKVLFATETLAAGVNMPARTTVISTVTKRINSEVVKLKTSQLLQMAGRAGRRGKDTEGTVVIMRNRFEDARMGHKILTSPVDGIKSHFKTSYGLTVKLLETRSIEECKQLIERGFGAYLLQQRIQKRGKEVHSEVEIFRSVLQRYTLKGARDYLKIARRLEKEQRNGEFLEQKLQETSSDLVQAIADYMPLGIGLMLRNDESGFFLGDVKWGSKNSNSGFGVVTRSGQQLVVRKEHIRAFAEPDDCLLINQAQLLLDMLGETEEWVEMSVEGAAKPMLQGKPSILEKTSSTPQEPAVVEVINALSKAPVFPKAQLPGSIIRHRETIAQLEAELNESPVTKAGEGALVLDALRYAAALKDPLAFINGASKGGGGGGSDGGANGGDIFAWRQFQEVFKLLQDFKALDGIVATELGQLVASLTSDNELWLALILVQPSVSKLSAGELAAVICAVVLDGHKAQGAYFKHTPSERVTKIFSELQVLSFELKEAQIDAGVDFPVNLSGEAGGLVESWVNGTSWRELCRETSLDQGDLCRILRRTVEALRQIPNAYGAPPVLSQLAMDAAEKMDRFPVADFDTEAARGEREKENEDTAGVGFGPGSAFASSGKDGTIDTSLTDSLMFEGDDDEEPQEDTNFDPDNLLSWVKDIPEQNSFVSRAIPGTTSTDSDDFALDAFDLDTLLNLQKMSNNRGKSPEELQDEDGGFDDEEEDEMGGNEEDEEEGDGKKR